MHQGSSLDLVGPLAEGRERWPGKNLAGSLPSSSGVDGDASLHLLCCAAARSYRHHDCQITVAIVAMSDMDSQLRVGSPWSVKNEQRVHYHVSRQMSVTSHLNRPRCAVIGFLRGVI